MYVTHYQYSEAFRAWYYSDDGGLSWYRCDRRQSAMARKTVKSNSQGK